MKTAILVDIHANIEALAAGLEPSFARRFAKSTEP